MSYTCNPAMRRPWPYTTRTLEPGRRPEAVTRTKRPGPGPSPTGWTNQSRFFRSMTGVVHPLGALNLATSFVTFAHYTRNRVSSRRRLAASIIYSGNGHHVIASSVAPLKAGQIAIARKHRAKRWSADEFAQSGMRGGIAMSAWAMRPVPSASGAAKRALRATAKQSHRFR